VDYAQQTDTSVDGGKGSRDSHMAWMKSSRKEEERLGEKEGAKLE